MNKILAVLTLLAFRADLTPGQTSVPANVSGSASFSGLILGDDGKPVPRAKLIYRKQSEYRRDQNGRARLSDPGFGGSVSVSSDGAFTLPGLPQGTYFMCAIGSQANQASDCTWDVIPVITISDGQSLGNIIRHVHDATVLTAIVHDPNGRIELPDAEGKVREARRFFLGAYSGSLYVRARLVSSSPTQKVYSIVFPALRSIQLFIDSELDVTDLNGKAVETRQPTSLTISPVGLSPITVDLNIP